MAGKPAEKSERLVVTSVLAIVRLEDGTPVHVLGGAPLPEKTSQASIDNLKSLGYVSDGKATPTPTSNPERDSK